MSEEKKTSENKSSENPSIWDVEPVTQCVTKSARSKDIQNKAQKKEGI